MTSGFNGSPTLSTCRSEVKSYFAAISSPAPINIRNAVGALYQTLTPSCSIVPYQLSGLKRPPTMTFVAPFSHGAKCRIPYLSPSPDQLYTSKCLLPLNQGPTFLSDIAESSLHEHEAHPLAFQWNQMYSEADSRLFVHPFDIQSCALLFCRFIIIDDICADLSLSADYEYML